MFQKSGETSQLFIIRVESFKIFNSESLGIKNGSLPVLTSFSAIKPEVEVGTIWFLICSLESHLLPFF